jgi:pimeloyl-ACP methyl ester carboxylesterase
MRRRQADPVGDRRLRAAIRPGPGSGPPLVVCNGIGTPLEALEPVTGVLDPAIEVVRFDVPGVGGSPAPRLPYTIQCLARLMAALPPDPRLHVYPDGHLGLLTRAAELAPVVSDLLLSVEPGARRAVQYVT